MTPYRDYASTASDKRMIEAWVARNLPKEDAEEGRAARLMAAGIMIREAMNRQVPGPDVPLLPPP